MIPRPRIEGQIWLRCGRSIGFAEYGPRDGKPILWFHGTPGGRHQIPPAARTYASERGVRLIALERPGVGASTPHVYPSVLGWADDIDETADRLGIHGFGMIGLSGGGPYVLACARRLAHRVVAGAVLGGVAPTRGDDASPGGLVGVAAALAPLLETAREPLGNLLWGIARSLVPFSSLAYSAFAELMPQGDRRVYYRPEMQEMFLDDLDRASRSQLFAPVYDLVQFTRSWEFSLRDIQVPIRFWHGDADNIVPLAHAERMAALVPNSELRVRPGEGHIGNLAAAEEIIDTLLSLWPREHGALRRMAGRDIASLGSVDRVQPSERWASSSNAARAEQPERRLGGEPACV
jgi:pimeloyl-ACP methyl ester carboxylesterase